MNIVRLALALTFALMPIASLAAPSPEEIIDGFFGPTPPPNRADFYTGEMKRSYSEEPTVGQMLLPGKHYTARRTANSPADAPVYVVTIDNGHEKIDWVAYFVRDGGILKLTAARPSNDKADSRR
jgi:hypothetical protein